jgi:type II secretory pathway component PulF
MADFRIHFYGNLSTLLSAGLPILRALHTTQGYARLGWKKILVRLEHDVSRGTELSESMAQWPRRFAKLDLALVRVGEQTGQLAELFKSLADWYELRRKLKHIVLSGMLYPLFILHLGALISPIPGAVLKGGGWESYRHGVFSILSLFYIPLAGVVAIRLLLPRQGLIRRIFDEIVLRIPLVGSAIKCLAIGRFSYLFSMMYKAGVPVIEAAKLATQSCGNEAIYRRLEGGYTATKQGTPMSKGFSQNLDPEFLELWSVGEESGELDKTSGKLGQIYLDKAQFRFEILAQWLPKIVYFAIMAVMAYQALKGFQAVYGGLLNEF